VGGQASVKDGLIAAVAVSGGFSLATRNIRNFNGIVELPLINPFEG
jgi:predicted nucleic acid-binding protein